MAVHPAQDFSKCSELYREINVLEGDIDFYSNDETDKGVKKLKELNENKEEKEKEMYEEKKKRELSNSGYCYVVMKRSTDSIPIHLNEEF